MKSVWPVFYSFDPEMVLHFHFTFKPFPGHAQKRESKRKKRAQPPKLTPIQLTLGHAKLTSPPILHGSPITEPNADPQSRSTVPIVIARSTAPTAILPSRRSRSREAPRRSQPLVEPNCLSLFLLLSIWPDLMIFFFLGFVYVSVLRNEWYYIFVWQPRKCEKMWPDLTGFDDFFFLGFVCVSILRNEWYYIFVWQPRKCDEQVENVFSMVFLITQPNTRKYFSKHFLKCNQTHENIFLSGK